MVWNILTCLKIYILSIIRQNLITAHTLQTRFWFWFYLLNTFLTLLNLLRMRIFFIIDRIILLNLEVVFFKG